MDSSVLSLTPPLEFSLYLGQRCIKTCLSAREGAREMMVVHLLWASRARSRSMAEWHLGCFGYWLGRLRYWDTSMVEVRTMLAQAKKGW
jgi:hypothetical protein